MQFGRPRADVVLRRTFGSQLVFEGSHLHCAPRLERLLILDRNRAVVGTEPFKHSDDKITVIAADLFKIARHRSDCITHAYHGGPNATAATEFEAIVSDAHGIPGANRLKGREEKPSAPRKRKAAES